jgi:co-chaperonin GroES (HSP10)
MIVEILPKLEVKTAGGLVIASDSRQVNGSNVDLPTLALVLQVGAGYVDENGVPEKQELKPGNVVLISEMGLKYYSMYPGLKEFTPKSIALTRESEVHMYWDSIEAFKNFETTINA